MPKISFNAQALGIARYEKGPDVSCAVARCAPQPVVVLRPGIEAIMEGLCLADIEGFVVPADECARDDIDP